MVRKLVNPSTIALTGILLVILCYPLFGGEDKDEIEGQDKPARIHRPVGAGGLFYARVKSLNDVYTPALFRTEVRIHPANGQWPSTQPDKTLQADNIITLVHIRGISTPYTHIDRDRPHEEIDRELKRFDEAMQFTRNLIDATDYLLLRGPEKIQEGEDGVLCDVFFDLGGKRIDFADTLVEGGYALRGGPYNWGLRIPKERK